MRLERKVDFELSKLPGMPDLSPARRDAEIGILNKFDRRSCLPSGVAGGRRRHKSRSVSIPGCIFKSRRKNRLTSGGEYLKYLSTQRK